MNIEKSIDGAKITFAVSGRIDAMTAPQLGEAVTAVLADADQVVFDFATLDYLSSAGLRVLLGAQKKLAAKGGVIVRNANETVMEIFEVTGFADILTIE